MYSGIVSHRFFSLTLTFIIFLLFPVHAQDILINEILASNTNTNLSPVYQEYADWIEIKNNTSSSINLGGYYLTDDLSNKSKWQIPANTIIHADSLLLFWADDKNSGVHTNFKLGKGGEFVGIFNAQGNVIDTVTFGVQSDDISYGRSAENILEWNYFSIPTPHSENITESSAILPAPEFSIPGGFYSGTQILILSTGGASSQIRYTTDGTPPDENSILYVNPINIDSTTAIRARSFETGKTSSEIITYTYFINEPVNLPVVSLVTDPDNFFDDEIGIYVTGTKGAPGDCDPTVLRNLNQDWERPVHVEFYETTGEMQLNQDAGIKIFGGCSRTRYPQKSLALYARSEYGTGSFDYKFFKNKPIEKFETIVLRGSSDDQISTMFRDGLAQTVVAQDPDADYIAYRPSVVYLNGEYWGIHNIREKLNEHFLKANYDVNEEEVNLLEDNPEWEKSTIIGSAQSYIDFLYYVETHDLSNESIYKIVSNEMDIDQFINYQIGHIYLAEEDWPANNIKYWKTNSGRYSKWRWINYDLDGCLYYYRLRDSSLADVVDESRADPNGWDWPNPLWSTVLLRKLLENTTFKNKFVQRFAYLMSTIYEPARVHYIIDSMKQAIAPEIPRHITKWGGKIDPDMNESWRPDPTFSSVEQWENNVQEMKEFAEQRQQYMISHILSQFELNGTFLLTVNSSIKGAGTVKITGMPVPEIGYSGTYFQGIPITIEAVPRLGYKFLYWKAGPLNITDRKTDITTGSNLSVIAYFEKETIADTDLVIINEINYNSANDFNTGDWVELYNRKNEDTDISGWTIGDENEDNTFVIPQGTIIKAHDYLVLCDNSSDFHKLVPGVNNYMGNFSFGLSGGGEVIRLISSNNILVDSVHYDNKIPWPANADGNGSTLELKEVMFDNDDPANWIAVASKHGTPGKVNSSVTSVVVENATTDEYKLMQNYPNPFNPVTHFVFRTANFGLVEIKLYDIIGREIITLMKEEKPAGEYEITFDGSKLASGVYYYQLKVNNFIATRKMVLLK